MMYSGGPTLPSANKRLLNKGLREKPVFKIMRSHGHLGNRIRGGSRSQFASQSSFRSTAYNHAAMLFGYTTPKQGGQATDHQGLGLGLGEGLTEQATDSTTE